MFKGRIGLWIILFVVCLVVTLCFEWLPGWLSTYDTTIMINVEKDSNMSEFLVGSEINKFNLMLNNENPNVIISSEQIEDKTYVEYKNLLSSPLVLYVPGQIHNNRYEGFVSVTGNCYQIELFSILEAIEAGVNFENLGFNKNVTSGVATLYIPGEQTPYYDEVIELFYLTLNKGHNPSTEDRKELKPRVEAILSKCVKVTDIRQAIINEAKSPSDNRKLFIGPEFLVQTCTNMFKSTGRYDDYTHVYFTKTVYLYANVYAKTTKNEQDSVGKLFVEDMQNEDDFMNRTGWRVANKTYRLSSYFMENP